MRYRHRWLAVVLLLAASGVLVWWMSQRDDDTYKSFDGEIFATHYRVTYRGGPDVQTLRQAVEAELHRIDAMASTWKPQSELMRLNRAQTPERFELSPQLAELLERARQIESQTDGAFSTRPDGEQIDLSGIAKGYAVDRVVELVQSEFGITDCMVDIGGEVKARGDGPKGRDWHVGLFVPSTTPQVASPTLQLRDTSIATSGTYFKGDHILDPRTGQPVVNELVSASVVHPSNTTADALATALYVMGPQRGLAWAQDNAVHVIFVLKDGTRHEYVPEQADRESPSRPSPPRNEKRIDERPPSPAGS